MRVKKRYYLFLIAFAVLNFSLQSFSSLFVSAGAWTVGAIICLYNWVHALEPMKNFGPINTVKSFYQRKDKLSEYQNLVRVLFFVIMIAGGVDFIKGIFDALKTYVF